MVVVVLVVVLVVMLDVCWCGGFFLACRNIGRFFDHSFPACFFFFFFFLKWRLVRIHSLGQVQSTVAQRAETTIAKSSLTMWMYETQSNVTALLAYRPPAVSLVLSLGRQREHVPLVPNFKLALTCDRQKKTLDNLL